MVVVIVLSIFLGGVMYIFLGGSRGGREAIANHEINEDARRIVDYITNDVREANMIDPKCPRFFTESQIPSLKTEDPDNSLTFTKINFDFTKDPAALQPGEVNYTQTKIQYFLEKENPSDAKSPWILYRRETPYDNKRQPETAKITRKPICDTIEKFVFYRLQPSGVDPKGVGASNVYISFIVARTDKKPDAPRFTTEVTTGIKVRGSEPQ